jgi:integrase
MVKLQRLTGCRPQEVRLLRFADIQRFDVPERPLPLFVAAERELAPPRELDEWLWRPARHKTEHHGRGRIIPIGPHGQGLLQPHLLRLAFKPDEFVFTTATGKPYTKDGYVRSIRRACEAAFHLPKGLRDRALSQAAKRLKTGSLAVLAGELTPEQLQAQAEQLQLQRQQATRWRDEHVWHPNQIRHTYATAARKVSDLEHVRTVLGHARSSTTEIYAERDLEKARAIARLIG